MRRAAPAARTRSRLSRASHGGSPSGTRHGQGFLNGPSREDSSRGAQGPDTVRNAPEALQLERSERSGVIWFILVAGIPASVLGGLAWRDPAREREPEQLARSSGRACRSGSPRTCAGTTSCCWAPPGCSPLRSRSSAASSRTSRPRSSCERRLPDARSIVWIRGRPRNAWRRVREPPHGWWAAARASAGAGRGARAGARARRATTTAPCSPGPSTRRTGAPGDLAMVRPVYAERDPARRPPRSPRSACPAGWRSSCVAEPSSPRTCAPSRRTGARCSSPRPGRPVSWSTPGTVAAARRRTTRSSARTASTSQGGAVGATHVARRSRAGPGRTGPGPAVTLLLGVLLSLLLFALLRLRRRAVLRRAAQGAGAARQRGAVPRARHLVAGRASACWTTRRSVVYVNERWADIHGIDPRPRRSGSEPLPNLDAGGPRRLGKPPSSAAARATRPRIECRVPRPEGGAPLGGLPRRAAAPRGRRDQRLGRLGRRT